MAKAFSTKRDVYLEIAERYEKYITLGVIKAGEKLPSVRVAAGELGVNPNTVQRAYSLLEERGFIRSMPKKGAFVIFGHDCDENDALHRDVVSAIVKLKDAGASMEEIISVLKEVYEND